MADATSPAPRHRAKPYVVLGVIVPKAQADQLRKFLESMGFEHQIITECQK